MELEARELRIGNYLTHNYQNDEVFSLSGFILYKLTVNENTGDELFCKPITLTRDWLLKLGFEYDSELNNYRYKHSQWLRIKIFPKDEGILIIDGKQYTFINNIHSLQNLFYCLTGTELQLQPTSK